MFARIRVSFNPFVSYRDLETNQTANINCRSGTIRMWVCPDWSSGVGPGATGRLLEMGDGATNGDLWALSATGDGTQLYFEARTNGVGFTNLTCDISWQSGTWHQIVLTYGGGGCNLYVDGNYESYGSYGECWPSRAARAAYGFSLGSSRDGTHQARGQFEELEAFNYPLAADDISSEYAVLIDPRGSDVSAMLPSVSTRSNSVTASVSGGPTAQMAVLVNSTNFESANWMTFGDSMTVALGTDGVYSVWFGFKSVTGLTNWTRSQIIVDTVPPQLFLACPTNVTQPVLQLTGYGSEPLVSIRVDIFNANGSLLDRNGFVMDEDYDAAQARFTTSHFQVFDLPLAPSTNRVVLRAADLAGNWATNVYVFTLDLSRASNAPVFTLLWPQDGDTVSGTEFSLRGQLDNPTASVTAQIVNTNGTVSAQGLVERNGLVWVERMPLTLGTNSITVTATDAATNTTTASLTVTVDSSLTIDDIPEYSLAGPTANYVSGTINMDDCTVWVNGLEAEQDEGVWHAYAVPLGLGGTAVIQARAIPNSGGGNQAMRSLLRRSDQMEQGASGDGTPANPDGDGSRTAELERDEMPVAYLAGLEGSATNAWTLSDTNGFHSSWVDWNVTDFHSEYVTNNPGSGSFGSTALWSNPSGTISGGSSSTSTYDWPSDVGPVSRPLTVFTTTCNWDSLGATNTDYSTNLVLSGGDVLSLYMGGNINAAVALALNVSQAAANGSGSASLEMNYTYKHGIKTAAKGVPGRRSLLLLQVGAVEFLDNNAPHDDDDVDDGFNVGPRGTPKAVSPQNLLVNGRKPGPNGWVYLVVPDGTNFDLTMSAPAMNYTSSVVVVQKFVLTNWCIATIPADRTRTNLGVGEDVGLKLAPTMVNSNAKIPPNAEWAATAGKVIPTYGRNAALPSRDDQQAHFNAPSNAANVTVSATVWTNDPIEVMFKVFAPTGVCRADIISTTPIPPIQSGIPGAFMRLNVFIGPTNVSFYKIKILEVPEPASNVRDYFASPRTWPGPHTNSVGANVWLSLSYANVVGQGFDQASYFGLGAMPPLGPRSQPWSPGGSFSWNIPARWKVGDKGQTNEMTGWSQDFTLLPNGTMIISKFGTNVTRTINNYTTPNL